MTGEIPAGAVPDQSLGKGEAIRIFTGALIPEGGGRVIMQEDTRREGDIVHIDRFQENRFIRPRGSEAKTGDIVLPAGTVLGPAEIAILAQVGAVRPARGAAARSSGISPPETNSSLPINLPVPARSGIRTPACSPHC